MTETTKPADRLKNVEGVKSTDAFTVPVDKIIVEAGFNARDFTLPENIAKTMPRRSGGREKRNEHNHHSC